MHNIEKQDLAVYRKEAWHGLGVVVGRLLTVEDINTFIQPHWPIIEHRETWVHANDGTLVPGSGRQVYNVTADKPLQQMGNRHTIMPFSVLGDTAIRFIEEGLSEGVESAGTLMDGRKAYVTLKVDEIEIPGYSNMYVLFVLTDVVDGTGAATGGGVIGVIVCWNTFQAYRLSKSFGRAWSIRHTSSMELNWDDAVTAFIEQQKQAKEIRQAVEQLINESYTTADFNQLVKGLLGDRPDDTGRARTMWQNRHDGLWTRYQGDDIAPLRDTKWGALMAVQGYEQHVAPVRGASREERHADKLMFGTQSLTDKAINLLAV